MKSPETAAAVMLTLPLLLRMAAAHFSDPDKALEFAEWCEEEAGRAGEEEAGITRPATPCGDTVFHRDPWEAWR